MASIVEREWVYLSYFFEIQFRQLFSYWVWGIVLGSMVSVFLKERIHQSVAALAGTRWGLWGVVPASLLGIASPLCLYGTVPLAASFSKSGMRDDWLAAFMMSSILLNPQLMVYSTALGMKVWMLRFFASFFCGVAAGLLVHIVCRNNRSFFTFSRFDEPENHDTDPRLFWRLLKNIGRNIKATGPWFLFGVLLSALFQRYVPMEAFQRLFGRNEGFGILMAATLGVPLYACGGATIPLLQQWLAGGMSLGNAVAFMIMGPATKITNLGALGMVADKKHFALYLLFVLAFSLAAGLIANCL
jgi:uncharacterized membrane protein YraQ (UPF0718 family)